MQTCTSLIVCMSILCMYVCLFVCLSLSICVCMRLFLCFFVDLSLSVCLFVCLISLLNTKSKILQNTIGKTAKLNVHLLRHTD